MDQSDADDDDVDEMSRLRPSVIDVINLHASGIVTTICGLIDNITSQLTHYYHHSFFSGF